jgi:hypothetical protein
LYQITFHNPFDQSINLQVSAGSNADPAANQLVFNSTLSAQTDTPAFDFGEDQNVVGWRRSAQPGIDNNQWTIWDSMFPNDQNTPTTIDLGAV